MCVCVLQIYYWVRQWNNFEYQLTFEEVIGKSLVYVFWVTVYNLRLHH